MSSPLVEAGTEGRTITSVANGPADRTQYRGKLRNEGGRGTSQVVTWTLF